MTHCHDVISNGYARFVISGRSHSNYEFKSEAEYECAVNELDALIDMAAERDMELFMDNRGIRLEKGQA